MSDNTAELSTSLQSVDAAPLHPRDVQSHQVNENTRQETQRPPDSGVCGGEKVVAIPSPGPNWSFNNLLIDLADKISANELKRAKSLFKGIIGRGILERLTTVDDFFDQLRTQMFLSNDNLLYLQTILRKLNRPELVWMTIDYARKAGNVIHFHEASDEPLNGYRVIKFHVEGKDFKNCTRSYIEDLRSKVSCLLIIPPQDVIIDGIEPSSSMIITIRIPDMYANILEEMLKHNEPLEQLVDLEIDTVQIGDSIYNIRGIEGVETNETEQQAKLVSVYQQLQEKSMQLERMAEETFIEKQTFKSKIEKLETEAVELKSLLNQDLPDEKTCTNDQTSIQKHFQSINHVVSLGHIALVELKY